MKRIERWLLADDSPARVKAITLAFWIPFLLFASVDAWGGRHNYAADALSYLDVSDAFLRRDWFAALNTYWSPGYPLLLAPAIAFCHHQPLLEFGAVRLTNLLVLVITGVCYHDLLTQIQRFRPADETPWLSRVQMLSVGLPMFGWGALTLNAASRVSPDMLVAATFFLLCAFLVRIGNGETGWKNFAALGLLIGLGYLIKTATAIAMPGVLICVLLLTKPAARPRILLSVAVAAMIAATFFVPLSLKQRRLSFGETGKLNYDWSVLGVQRDIHWQGAVNEGTPIHPTRVLSLDPPVFEFAAPFKVHYPPWFDPGYWYEGVRVRLSPLRQLRVFALNLVKLLPWLLGSVFGATILIALTLVGAARRRAFLAGAHLWFLPAISIIPIVTYCLVVVEKRYLMGYAVVVFLLPVLLSAGISRKHLAALTVIYWVALFGGLAPSTARIGKEIIASKGHMEDDEWNVAADLARAGLRPGDSVAAIDDTMFSAWPRLAQVRVIAEIPLRRNEVPTDQVQRYWKATPERQLQVLQLFRSAGAKAVVASPPPAGFSVTGWEPVGKMGYLLRRF